MLLGALSLLASLSLSHSAPIKPGKTATLLSLSKELERGHRKRTRIGRRSTHLPQGVGQARKGREGGAYRVDFTSQSPFTEPCGRGTFHHRLGEEGQRRLARLDQALPNAEMVVRAGFCVVSDSGSRSRAEELGCPPASRRPAEGSRWRSSNAYTVDQ